MAANQPPPRATDPDEERKLQLFLERAAPIVLESRVLDEHNWKRLVVLAQELELSDGQLRSTLEDLRRRGVIERVDLAPIKPAPKPPPLPAPRATTKRRSEDAQPSVDGGTATASQPREEEFSLNTPTPPQPPPPPSRVSPPAKTKSPGKVKPPAKITPAASVKPPPAKLDGPAVKPARTLSPREQLSQRAAAIIAEQQGFSPKTHSMIASAAKDLGLSDQVVSEVIRSLHQGNGQPSEKDAADDASQRQRWKEEGKPEPPRHEASQKPHEIFSAFVAQSLDKLAVGHVSSDLEEGLVVHGTKVLKLSKVYATQLVRDVAKQKELLLETDAKLQTETVAEPEQLDPRLKTFLDRAAPILAQNRGLNARSRVLLGAMAEEVGLAQEEVDGAVALLETKPAETDGLNDSQRQRLAPFRRYASELLGQLPQPILTARIHTTMLERAEERFGIDPDRAHALLRELAGDQQIQVITEEEAVRHVESLVAEHLGDALRLDADVKLRIRQEGGHWGLSTEQIERIINQHSRKNYKKRQSERNLSNVALVGALVAVLLVVGFLGWAMFGGRMLPTTPEPETPDETGPVVTTTPNESLDDSWWDVKLVLAVHNATSEFPLLRRTLKAIASTDAEQRAISYSTITNKALDQTDDALQRDILLRVISQAYTVEPSEATAEKIRRGLLDVVPGPEDRLSERAADYPKIFWAMRGAVGALDAAQDNARRADDIAQSIGQVVGTTIDRDQTLPKLEQQCLGALAERLFRLMIASAASRSADSASLHRVIAEEAGRYLGPTRLETLNADFLASFLAANPAGWREFEALIQSTVSSRDPLVVAMLIGVFETTGNAELQADLKSRLLSRAKLTPMTESIRGLASEIRQALGITEVVTAEGRTLDFMQLAKRELAYASTQTDPRLKAVDLATRLARVATLGCALSQDERGFATFDELIKQDPPDLTAASTGDASPFPASTGTDFDALEKIDSALSRLQREGSARRVERVETMASAAARVRDLKPDQATLFASYLLAVKTMAEHERILQQLSAFRHWSQLYLAVADGLYRTKVQREQLQTLLSRLLGEEVELGDGEAGREAIRGMLLRRAMKLVGDAGPSVSQPELVDQARSLLHAEYVRQAVLLGVPATQYADTTEPVDVLKAIIEQYSAGLSASGADKETARQLAEIPYQLRAIEYAATNSLQQTVLIERIWLRVLTAALRKRTPDAAESIGRIMRDLHEADRSAGNSFAQLQASQTALVHVWMLWNRPK